MIYIKCDIDESIRNIEMLNSYKNEESFIKDIFNIIEYNKPNVCIEAVFVGYENKKFPEEYATLDDLKKNISEFINTGKTMYIYTTREHKYENLGIVTLENNKIYEFNLLTSEQYAEEMM